MAAHHVHTHIIFTNVLVSCFSSYHTIFQEGVSNDDPLADLQRRLADLELTKKHNDTAEMIKKERAEMLLSLRDVMEAMKAEAAGGAGGASSKELEKLREENKELKKVNAKQQYRIEHLVHNLREIVGGGKQ